MRGCRHGTGRIAGQAAITPLAFLIFRDALEQMHPAKLRPQGGSHIDFRVSQLPQQKVAQPHLTAGANHQIGIGQMPRVEMTRHRVLVDFQMIQAAIARGRVHDRAERIHQFGACAVVERESQHHAGVVRCGLARPLHLLLHRGRQFVLASDVFQANIVLVQRGNFCFQIAAEQTHQEIDFAAGTLLPVLLGKRVQRERGNADAGRGFDRRAHRRDSGAMSGDARQMAPARPAAVAVHDNGDVFWEPLRIQPQINFRFLAIQPGRNCCLQANLCCLLKLTQRDGACNDTRVHL